MITIKGNTIQVPKGDTGVISFESDEPLSAGKWIFCVKPHVNDTGYLIQKEKEVGEEEGVVLSFSLLSHETELPTRAYVWGLRHIGRNTL